MLHPVRTVAAVHDLSGIGRCALTVVIPVLSAMGIQVCPVPTAVLSAHTGFHDIEVTDLSEYIGRQLDAWNRMGLRFDGIYTGYLSSPAQADLIRRFACSQPAALTVIDPVMGDDGVLYRGISEETVSSMRSLCSCADVITPNLTEYCALTGRSYADSDRSRAEIREMLLSSKAKQIVITSVLCEGKRVNACRDKNGEISILPYRAFPVHYPGTGDLFASVLTGYLLRGNDLARSVGKAAEHVSYTVEISMGVKQDLNYGVQLEASLGRLIPEDL